MTASLGSGQRAADTALGVAGEADGPAWDAYVRRHPDGEVFQTWAWRRTVTSAYGHTPHYLVARRGPELCGVLPLFHLRSRIFGDSLASAPYATSGGILADQGSVAAALARRAEALAGELGARYLEIKSVRRTPEAALEPSTDYVTYRLPLADAATLWDRRLRGRGRTAVRKAERSGLRAVWGVEGFDDFYEILVRSMRRLGTPVHARGFFRAVLDAFGERAEIVVVRDRRGEALAGALVLRHGAATVLYAGGDRSDRRDVNPFSCCIWSLIRRAAERGDTLLDLGRSPRGGGTARFKEQWGAEPVALWYEYWVRPGGGLPRIHVGNPRYAAARALWRRLPLGLTRWLGPHLIRSIP